MSSPAALVAALSLPAPACEHAARTIKNLVIGNPTNKHLFLSHSLLPALLALLPTAHPALLAHLLPTLGSLSPHLPPPALPPVLHALLPALFRAPTATPALRALKLLAHSHARVLAPQLPLPTFPARLVFLLRAPRPELVEPAAIILARFAAAAAPVAQAFVAAAAVPALVALLADAPHPNALRAALDALAALAAADSSVVHSLTKRMDTTALIAPVVRASRPSLRLAAARLLTIFHAKGRLQPDLDLLVANALVDLVDLYDDVGGEVAALKIDAMHTLARLLHRSEGLQRAAADRRLMEKLAKIVNDAPDAEKRLNEEHLAMLDGHPQDTDPTKPSEAQEAEMCAAAVTALAAVAAEYDPARDAAIRLGLLPKVVEGLESEYPQLALGCLKCLRSLSKSVKVVRRDMSNERVAAVLLELMENEDKEVSRIASATLCNLVLEFSPIRLAILERGATKMLVEMIRSDDEELRDNALWALKNLFFKADADTKNAVMEALGYDSLQALCADKSPRVRELAMAVIRNLACSGSAEQQSKQLDALFAATGNRLIALLSDALRADMDNPQVAVQAMYVVCNIASGTEEHKASLINSDIPQLLLWWSSHADENARIAAVWCTTNLSGKSKPITPRRASWLMRSFQMTGRNTRSRLGMLRRQHLPLPGSPAGRRHLEALDAPSRRAIATAQAVRTARENRSSRNVDMDTSAPSAASSADVEDSVMSSTTEETATNNSGYAWRIGRLRELGFECRLRTLLNDPHIEVQGRARAALELFDGSEDQQLDYNPTALQDYNATVGTHTPRSPPVLSGVVESDSSSPTSSR